jgi:hypothetical protein
MVKKYQIMQALSARFRLLKYKYGLFVGYLKLSASLLLFNRSKNPVLQVSRLLYNQHKQVLKIQA